MREQPFLEPSEGAALRFRRKNWELARMWLVRPLLVLDWRVGLEVKYKWQVVILVVMGEVNYGAYKGDHLTSVGMR